MSKRCDVRSQHIQMVEMSDNINLCAVIFDVLLGAVAPLATSSNEMSKMAYGRRKCRAHRFDKPYPSVGGGVRFCRWGEEV